MPGTRGRPQRRPAGLDPGGLRLLAGIEEWPARQRNVWRYTFLHPAVRTVFDDWQGQLRGCVRHQRALSGLEPDAPDLAAIVGELVLKSPEFAKRWDRYDVAGNSRRTKTFHHPESATCPWATNTCSSTELRARP